MSKFETDKIKTICGWASCMLDDPIILFMLSITTMQIFHSLATISPLVHTLAFFSKKSTRADEMITDYHVILV